MDNFINDLMAELDSDLDKLEVQIEVSESEPERESLDIQRVELQNLRTGIQVVKLDFPRLMAMPAQIIGQI